MYRHCKATRKDGQPCGGWALEGSDYCFTHDPSKAKERKEARAKGGRHGKRGQAPTFAEQYVGQQFRTLLDIELLLEAAIRRQLKLENNTASNRCLGYLAGQWAKVHEVGQMESRLEILEQALMGHEGG